MDVAIFANGEILDEPLVQQLIPLFRDNATVTSVFIIAADGGLRAAQRFGLKPSLIIGDMDSVTPDELRPFETDPTVTIVRHPAEKDATDLELALLWAATNLEIVDSIIIFGGLGGRMDQTLANLYLLALPELSAFDIRLVDGEQQIRLLRSGFHKIEGATGDTISLIPLGGAVSGIHTDGLYYPLHSETLKFGPARGVSNVMTQNTATVSLVDGALLLIHTLGRA